MEEATPRIIEEGYGRDGLYRKKYNNGRVEVVEHPDNQLGLVETSMETVVDEVDDYIPPCHQRDAPTLTRTSSPAKSVTMVSAPPSAKSVICEPKKMSQPPATSASTTSMANMILNRRRVLKILEQRGTPNDAKLVEEVVALSNDDLMEIIKEDDQRLAKNAVIILI